MKTYRTLPRTDAEHQKDMELLDFLQRKVDWCEKLKNTMRRNSTNVLLIYTQSYKKLTASWKA